MATKGHGDTSGLHGCLVVPQLVDSLLLQEQSLLGEQKTSFQGSFLSTSLSCPQSPPFSLEPLPALHQVPSLYFFPP